MRKWLEILAHVANIFAFFVAVIGLLYLIFVQRQVAIVGRELTQSRFVITSPHDGATVNLTVVIQGRTPYPEKRQYLVVTPVETGDDWVQDSPVTVYVGGVWQGRAIFGTAAVGQGQKFIVRCLATDALLTSVRLPKILPKDSVFSEPITVTRQ